LTHPLRWRKGMGLGVVRDAGVRCR